MNASNSYGYVTRDIGRFEDMDLCCTAPTHYRYQSNDQHPLQYLFQAQNASKLLLIAFHGAVGDRNRFPLPIFRYHNYNFDANFLSIADSTMAYDDDMEIGWYLGAKDSTFREDVIDLIEFVQRELAIERTVCVGSSGGGYAALSFGARLGCRVVCVNPQIDPKVHDQICCEKILKVCGSETVDRSSVLTCIRESQTPEKIIYVQNIDDKKHFTKQFLPFVSDLGDLHRKLRLRIELFTDSTNPHVAPLPFTLKHLIKEAFD